MMWFVVSQVSKLKDRPKLKEKPDIKQWKQTLKMKSKVKINYSEPIVLFIFTIRKPFMGRRLASRMSYVLHHKLYGQIWLTLIHIQVKGQYAWTRFLIT